MKIQNRDGSVTAEIEPGLKALRAQIMGKTGIGFACTGVTGTIAASLAANSSIWVLRNGYSGPTSSTAPIILVDRIRIKTTSISGAVGVQTGQLVALYKGNPQVTAPTLTGGTAIVAANKHSLRNGSLGTNFSSSGDIRIATTAALTNANVTYDSNPIRREPFMWQQAVGAFQDTIWEFSETESMQLALKPGQFLAIRNPAAFPSATYFFQIDCDYREVNENYFKS